MLVDTYTVNLCVMFWLFLSTNVLKIAYLTLKCQRCLRDRGSNRGGIRGGSLGRWLESRVGRHYNVCACVHACMFCILLSCVCLSAGISTHSSSRWSEPESRRQQTPRLVWITHTFMHNSKHTHKAHTFLAGKYAVSLFTLHV